MSEEILIVDDNADIRNIINELIKDAGYKTRLAANYNQALGEIDKKLPDGKIGIRVVSTNIIPASWNKFLFLLLVFLYFLIKLKKNKKLFLITKIETKKSFCH